MPVAAAARQQLLLARSTMYQACPESRDTKVLNMYNIFNLQKPHCQSIACT